MCPANCRPTAGKRGSPASATRLIPLCQIARVQSVRLVIVRSWLIMGLRRERCFIRYSQGSSGILPGPFATAPRMESEFIAWLQNRLPGHERLAVGVGDDAALVRLAAGGKVLVSVDVLTDGVDFHLAEVDARRIGRKALAVNLSDMAAMAGRPLAVVVGVVLPRTDGLGLAQELAEGMIPLAEQFDVAFAGGDTNSWDGPLVISVTILGEPTLQGPLRRQGAKPGDVIIVTGSFGGSILGHQFDFEPRVREALLLHERYDLHAGIDVSDGLSLDLSRLAAASGCGAGCGWTRCRLLRLLQNWRGATACCR